MELSTDGGDQPLISNLVSILLQQLKSTPKRGYLDYLSNPPLLRQLSRWLRIHGMKLPNEDGVESTALSGDVLELLSIEMLREMLQSALTAIRESGFPEKGQKPVVSVVHRHIMSDDTYLTIKLSIEKA